MRVVLTRRESIEHPDGVSIFIVALALALLDLRHEVRIVTGWLESLDGYRRGLAPQRDLPLLPLSARPVRGAAALKAWLCGKRVIDAFDPDLVIHSEAIPLPFRGTVVQAVHDLQPRSSLLAPLWRAIRRVSTRHCAHVVATTTELREALVSDLGLPASEIRLIPKCVHRPLYAGQALAERERAILHAGTQPYKDPTASIRAFWALDDPTARLYVVGVVTSPVQEAMAALPERVGARVVLLGELEGAALRALHGRVRVASFPTRYAVPVASATVMEAIASGTPLVGSSRLSRDLLVDKRNGLVVDTGPEPMAAAFRALLDEDQIWSRLAAGADEMVERFDAHRVAAEYLALASPRGPFRHRTAGAPARPRV